ncbi:uncharacterized protein B0T15DRAFT_257681 [Chaetomium strumarium]|uniref:Uncharacterized protein n=1 Tax=Chaetomium strumarium TaxID=1170767 RepID=A0AAJ0GN74_9PEZI|nr:hypothetical protein B0T15DRAFT_257681 [Chaetomium strumarium]
MKQAYSLPRQPGLLHSPPCGGGPKPASRGHLVRNVNPSAAILGASLRPPLPQDAHDAHRDSTGKSWHDAVLIPSDDESDADLNGSRSDPRLSHRLTRF